MFRNFFKNREGQNTAEYALLIALVVAGIIAMQTYAQRALQARVRDASVFMVDKTPRIGNSVQYEPYYMQTNYDVTRDSVENKRLGQGLVASQSASERKRDGQQKSAYDPAAMNPADNKVEKNIMPNKI